MGVTMKKLYFVLFLLFSGAYAWSADASDSDSSTSAEELYNTLYKDYPPQPPCEAVPFRQLKLTYATTSDGTPPYACDGGTIPTENQVYNGNFLTEETIRHLASGASMHPEAMKAVSEQLLLSTLAQTQSEGER